jgi:hypothetical protein
MDTLTSEILHNIFIHLELKHRLVCTLVCRRWWHILDKVSLFYCIEIIQRNNTFKKCIHQFEQRPHRAAQVEVLVFETRG